MIYCSDCEEFFTEKEMDGGHCPCCGKVLIKCPECGSTIDACAETCSSCGAVFSSEDGDYFSNSYDI